MHPLVSLLRWLLLLPKPIRRGTSRLLRNLSTLLSSVRRWLFAKLGIPASDYGQVKPTLPPSPPDNGTETFFTMADPGPSNMHADDVLGSHVGINPGTPHTPFRSFSGDHLTGTPHPSSQRSSRISSRTGSQTSLQDQPNPIIQTTTHHSRSHSTSTIQEVRRSSPHPPDFPPSAAALGPYRARRLSQKSVSRLSNISQFSVGGASDRPPSYREHLGPPPHFRPTGFVAPPSSDKPDQPGEPIPSGAHFYPMSANDVLRYERRRIM